MAFLLDDAAFGGQLMVGAGQPVSIGVGPGSKVRGSAFVEAPMQVGKASAFNSAEGTLMVGQTDNVDCDSPKRSLYVKGDVKIDGDRRTPNALHITGTHSTLLQVDGNVVGSKNIKAQKEIYSNGGAHRLSAKKNFDIPHPTKKGWRLTHACVEGPEAAVYIRGRVTNRTEIELPLYWKELVDIQSITVNLTPIGAHQDVIIKRWDEKKIYLQAKGGMPIDCFYYIMAERKDTEKLIPEYQGTIEDYPGDNSQRSIVGYHYDVKGQ
jgi:hypothetical protein